MSAAFVAVTTHDPAAVGDKVEPAMEQSPETFVNVTVPVPEPPAVVNARFVPNVADVLEMVSGD